jgi:hypothetical protein
VLVTSAGLADETVVIAVVECQGTPHTRDLDGLEEIEVLVLNYAQVRQLRESTVKMSAKAWLVLMMFEAQGRIGWPDQREPA